MISPNREKYTSISCEKKYAAKVQEIPKVCSANVRFLRNLVELWMGGRAIVLIIMYFVFSVCRELFLYTL